MTGDALPVVVAGVVLGVALGLGLRRALPREMAPARLAGLVTSTLGVVVAVAAILLYAEPSPRAMRWPAGVILVLGAVALVFPARVAAALARVTPAPRAARTSSAYVDGLRLGPGAVLAAAGTAVVLVSLGDRTPLTAAIALVGAIIGLAGTVGLSTVRRGIARTTPVVALALVVVAAVLVRHAPAAVRSEVVTDGSRQSAEPARDQGYLAQLSSPLNQELDRCEPGAAELARCGAAPPLRGISHWFNTPGERPVTLRSLRGKVVLVDFWAYSCVNCRRNQPYLDAWYAAYRDAGLVVVGVQSPELDFEARSGNVERAVARQDIDYPVALDPRLRTWTDYRNRYWPAKYLVDAGGTVRSIKFGEGDYARTETQIRALLRAAHPGVHLPAPVSGSVRALEPPAEGTTPETFLGWNRTRSYAGTPAPLVADRRTAYTLSSVQPANTFSLGGSWRVGSDVATAEQDARLRIAVDARRVYAVVAGQGSVSVSADGGPTRTVQVSGPDLYPLSDFGRQGQHVLDLQFAGGLRVYTFSFG